MSYSIYKKYLDKKDQVKKMRNVFTVCAENHKHRSKLEASVCQILHVRKKMGEIKEIKVEDHLYLTDARIGYVVDFRCTCTDNSIFWVEAKGYPDAVWPIKVKLWKIYGPGNLEIWKGSWREPLLDEVLIPQLEIVDRKKKRKQ